MSSKSESPINKVIFLQKIFRFAGRTIKDLVIINSVCRDFEETMQVHHTFNLVLYDNIIKKRKDEEAFLYRSVELLITAPAWIVYQWTIVNEHDAAQRELLKAFLLLQAEMGNEILIRRDVSGEAPTTTRELFRHVLASCVTLGIVKEVLVAPKFYHCIVHAVLRNVAAESLAFLIESCVQHGVDMKKLLEAKNDADLNCISLAACYHLSVDSFKLLIESCVHHGVDMKKMFEETSGFGRNCIMLACYFQLPVDYFKLIIECCIQHGVDVKNMLEQKDHYDDTWRPKITMMTRAFLFRRNPVSTPTRSDSSSPISLRTNRFARL